MKTVIALVLYFRVGDLFFRQVVAAAIIGHSDGQLRQGEAVHRQRLAKHHFADGTNDSVPDRVGKDVAFPKAVAALRDDGSRGSGGGRELILKREAREDDLTSERQLVIQAALLVEAHRQLDDPLRVAWCSKAQGYPVVRNVGGIHDAVRAFYGFTLEPDDGA